MKKIAIFTEGHGELVFTRNMLLKLFGHESISFMCFMLQSGDFKKISYSVILDKPSIYFLLVVAASDEGVLTAIKDREKGLCEEGFDLIIGLRDVYSGAYRKRSKDINDQVTNALIQKQRSVIQAMHNPDKINLYFAIMEFEAWLLAMHSLFAKIHPKLTVNFIQEKLGFNLESISPQTTFFHPANEVEKIFGLVGKKYDKSLGEMESISSLINDEDIAHALETGRCESFASFWTQLNSLNERSVTSGPHTNP